MEAAYFSVLTLGAALIAILAVAWLFFSFSRRLNDINARNALLTQRLDESQQGLSDISNQLAEIQTRSMVQGRHMQEVTEQCTALENQLREVRMQDPSVRLYSRAAELVKSGASAEEIMQACDLPRAEVDLLINISRKS